MRKLLFLAAVLLALGVTAGCGGGDDGEKSGTAGDNPVSTKAAETPAISSGIEGVPIPRDAHRSQENKSVFEVLGMTFDEVVEWYDIRMPEGKDFKRWQWCDTDVDTENPIRRYSQGSRILSVAITDDTPPGVRIGVKSGTC
jgi:hypothetical protein